jgi:uncharacterized protein (TIGR03435 family)
MGRDKPIALSMLLTTCLAATLFSQPRVEFDVASIKPTNTAPGRDSFGGGYCHGTDTRPGTYPRRAAPTSLGECRFTSVYVPDLIRSAYGPYLSFPALTDMVKGGPDWLRSQRFDVVARAADPSTATAKMLRQMMQTLLSDRFKLAVHFETRTLRGYELLVVKNGPRLQPATGEELPRIVGGTPPSPDLFLMIAQHASMRGLASSLSTLGIGPVVDKTGLHGAYDFRLLFARDSISAVKGRPLAPSIDAISSGPTFASALDEQLGLRLVRAQVPVEYVFVDSVERPSEN